MITLYTKKDQNRFEELDTETQDRLEALGYFHGEDYYNTLEDALNNLEDTIRQFTGEDDLTSFYDLARRLDTTLNLEEDLLYVLGCSAEAMEQLGRYVHADDIEHTLDIEFSMVLVNGKCYENVGN